MRWATRPPTRARPSARSTSPTERWRRSSPQEPERHRQGDFVIDDSNRGRPWDAAHRPRPSRGSPSRATTRSSGLEFFHKSSRLVIRENDDGSCVRLVAPTVSAKPLADASKSSHDDILRPAAGRQVAGRPPGARLPPARPPVHPPARSSCAGAAAEGGIAGSSSSSLELPIYYVRNSGGLGDLRTVNDFAGDEEGDHRLLRVRAKDADKYGWLRPRRRASPSEPRLVKDSAKAKEVCGVRAKLALGAQDRTTSINPDWRAHDELRQADAPAGARRADGPVADAGADAGRHQDQGRRARRRRSSQSQDEPQAPVAASARSTCSPNEKVRAEGQRQAVGDQSAVRVPGVGGDMTAPYDMNVPRLRLARLIDEVDASRSENPAHKVMALTYESAAVCSARRSIRRTRTGLRNHAATRRSWRRSRRRRRHGGRASPTTAPLRARSAAPPRGARGRTPGVDPEPPSKEWAAATPSPLRRRR